MKESGFLFRFLAFIFYRSSRKYDNPSAAGG